MILDRYLIREVTLSSVSVASAFVGIFLAYSLTRFLTDAAGGLFKANEVAQLTLYKSIIALEVLLPLALFFGIIIGFGRLNTSTEITAMHASGISRSRLHRSLLFLSLLAALSICALSTTVRPWAYNAMYELTTQAEASYELGRIKPQRFYFFDEGNRTIYVEGLSKNGQDLRGVFIRTRNLGDIEVISSDSGKLETYVSTTSHRLTLHDASIFKSAADSTDFLGNFKSLKLYLEADREVVRKYRSKSERTQALFHSKNTNDRAEFQWRLSTPISTVLLVLVGLRLVDSKPSEGKYARVPAAIGVYLVYYNLLSLGRTWVEQGIFSNIWWVPGLLACLILGLAVRARANSRP